MRLETAARIACVSLEFRERPIRRLMAWCESPIRGEIICRYGYPLMTPGVVAPDLGLRGPGTVDL